MREYLKIKVMSLAAEVRIIKTQEQRTKERLAKHHAKMTSLEGVSGDDAVALRTRLLADMPRESKAFWGMRGHRLELRREARLSHLAYCCLKGRSFQACESWVHANNRLKEADWDKIAAMIAKYGEGKPGDNQQRLSVFKEEWSLIADEAPWVTEEGRAYKNAKRRTAYNSRPRRSRNDWENSKTAAGAQ